MTNARFDRNVARASEAFDAGFASEAKRKEALGYVNSAFDALTDAMRSALLDNRPENFDALYWGAPMYPHQWTAKHCALFAAYPEFVAQAQSCRDLRDAMKAAPVAPKAAPVEEHAAVVTVRKSLQEQMDAMRARYTQVVNVGRILGGMPVSVRGFYCQNEAGTVWVRMDWYFHGRRTSQNVILAAYDTLVREGVIKPE